MTEPVERGARVLLAVGVAIVLTIVAVVWAVGKWLWTLLT